MTDDADGSAGMRDAEEAASAVDDEAAPSTDGAADAARGPRAASEVDFADLSLPQRVFVAAVQNPTRGVVIVALFAFAFSFYIAFWMVFPRIAAVTSGVVGVLAVVLAGIYYLLARYVD